MAPDGPAPSKPAGVLRPWQRRLYRLLLVPLGLIAANSIFIAAFTRDTAFFYAMLLLHLTLGLLIAVPFFVFAADARPPDDPDVEPARQGRGPRDRRPRARVRGDRSLHDASRRDPRPPRRLARPRHRRCRSRSSPSSCTDAPTTHQLQFRRLFAWGGGVAFFLAGMAVVAKLEKPPKRIVNVNGDTVFYPSAARDLRPGAPRRKEARRQRLLPGVPSRLLPPVGALGAPLLVVQQPVLPKERRADGRPGRPRADEVVLGLPRPGRSLHGPDGKAPPRPRSRTTPGRRSRA